MYVLFTILFFCGLSILKYNTKTGFYIAQLIVAFIWAGFYLKEASQHYAEEYLSLFILWILASLAALTIKSKNDD